MTIRSLLLLVALTTYASEPAIILGVLEDNPGHYVGQPSSRAVRVIFQKHGSEWQPFPASCPDQQCLKTIASKYPPSITWNIAFSGRSLGQVTAATPKDFEFYADIGLQKITSKGPVPAAAKKMIADSQPYFRDPDSWKPSHPPVAQQASLRLAFRKKFPQVSNCSSEDSVAAKPWPYRDADLRINKAYSSNKGWSAVQLLLTGYRCEGPQDDAFIDQWFAVTPRGEILFLGEGLTLVDAGDYDDDGKSEIIFAIERANEGGYELFHDDFKGHAVFQFSYH
jgi:hypothetical protein